ncbi:hypothetical protein RUND412_004396 [Rhizina undulata]
MRKALLNAAVVGGLLKAMNSIILNQSTTNYLTNALDTSALSPTNDARRGNSSHRRSNAFLAQVPRKVMASMNSSYEDLAVVARAIYRSVLGNFVVLDLIL